MKRTRETADMLDMLDRVLAAVERRLGHEDPDVLPRLAAISRRVDRLQLEAVRGLRAAAVTWEDIGAATGVTRQAALMKWTPRLQVPCSSKVADRSHTGAS